MDPIIYIDRTTGKRETEKVYKAYFLSLLYGNSFLSTLIGKSGIPQLVRSSLFASLYGYWKKRSASGKEIEPFIKQFNIDDSEFLDNIDSYKSFNDFFIRKLKPEARPICSEKDHAIIPADGRYYFYQNINNENGFIVKSQKFCISTLLQDEHLSQKYANGSMIIARLCPTDYHRFHFPCDCLPQETRFINGWLYSVNPNALKKNINIFTENKRTVCQLNTEQFGTVLFLEIGATNVGSIHETYTPQLPCKKGEEKGFFSFGGSALILLFEEGRINLDKELLEATAQQTEIRCLMGQSMGRCNIKR